MTSLFTIARWQRGVFYLVQVLNLLALAINVFIFVRNFHVQHEVLTPSIGGTINIVCLYWSVWFERTHRMTQWVREHEMATLKLQQDAMLQVIANFSTCMDN